MALPIIANTIRCSVEGLNADGTHWANVLHFRWTGAITSTAAIAIIDPKLLSHYTVNAGAGGAWVNHATTSASLQRFRYTPLDGSTATTVAPHVVSGASNPTTNNAMANNVALVTTFYTAKRGRSYRGRVYEGTRNENENGPDGRPTSITVTAQNTQWTALLTALSGSGTALVVASYLHSTADDVISVFTNGRWDSQRRRLGD